MFDNMFLFHTEVLTVTVLLWNKLCEFCFVNCQSFNTTLFIPSESAVLKKKNRQSNFNRQNLLNMKLKQNSYFQIHVVAPSRMFTINEYLHHFRLCCNPQTEKQEQRHLGQNEINMWFLFHAKKFRVGR